MYFHPSFATLLQLVHSVSGKSSTLALLHHPDVLLTLIWYFKCVADNGDKYEGIPRTPFLGVFWGDLKGTEAEERGDNCSRAVAFQGFQRWLSRIMK